MCTFYLIVLDREETCITVWFASDHSTLVPPSILTLLILSEINSDIFLFECRCHSYSSMLNITTMRIRMKAVTNTIAFSHLLFQNWRCIILCLYVVSYVGWIHAYDILHITQACCWQLHAVCVKHTSKKESPQRNFAPWLDTDIF